MFSFSLSKPAKYLYLLILVFLLLTVFGLIARIASNASEKNTATEDTDAIITSSNLDSKDMQKILKSNDAVSGSGSDSPKIYAILSSTNSIDTIKNAMMPQLLIYHTHDCEAYEMTKDSTYKQVGDARTKEQNHSVVEVGTQLLYQLNMQFSIRGIQDKTSHEYPKLSTAYSRSLATASTFSEELENPLLIDIHRDAYTSRSWDPSYVVIDGKRTARIMVVVGKGEGYEDKPDYKINLAYAQALTDALNDIYPGLAKAVKIKDGRYNQHLSNRAILIEVGHHENTLEEAINSCKYLAMAIEKTFFTNAS